MESKEPTEEKMIKAVKSYYGLKIDENAYNNADIYAYEETTVDGYSVYVVTHDMKNVAICEDVYYYDSDVAEAIMEMVTDSNGYCTLYADEYFLDDIYFNDNLLEQFSEIAENIYQEIQNDEGDYGFDMAEILWLKEEFTESEEINQTVSQLIVVQFPRTSSCLSEQQVDLSTDETRKVWAFRGMRTFDKYKENLREHNGEIWSYSTKVAEIKDDGKLHQLGWWSVTTQKHINYAAKELGLELVK